MPGDDTIISPYLRKPQDGTREGTAWMMHCTDVRIAKLAKLGSRRHPKMTGYRNELSEYLESGGPYKLRVSSTPF